MERARTHPAIVAAAFGVLLFCVIGAAALTGVLPVASSNPEGEAAKPARSAPAIKKAAPPAVKPRVVAKCAECGVIQAVRVVEVQGETSGIGAVAGGVTGAVVGNQFGRGTGRTVMTVAGTAAGALAGNEIEKRARKATAHRVTLRMDDGSARTLTLEAAPGFGVGERVRIGPNGTLERA